jgi:hypothetical protein
MKIHAILIGQVENEKRTSERFRKVVKFYISLGHLWEGNNLNFGTLNCAWVGEEDKENQFSIVSSF